jgi:hypothetical protein
MTIKLLDLENTVTANVPYWVVPDIYTAATSLEAAFLRHVSANNYATHSKDSPLPSIYLTFFLFMSILHKVFPQVYL